MSTKLPQFKDITEEGIKNPEKVLPQIKTMAADSRWETREVAATILTEMSKKRAEDVIKEMTVWAADLDENVRRTSIESLRSLCRIKPQLVLAILENLKQDNSLYVKKAVAHILREISKKNPDFVYDLCKKWTKIKDGNTNWIIKDGFKKLDKDKQAELTSLLKQND